MNPYFLIFECLVYGLFAACMVSAARRGRFAALELVWMAVYGFLLEWLTLKQLGAYVYGEFAVMIDGAPLAVALGWAVIIDAGLRFSDRIRLPDTARPLLDALLALNIDIALDTIAIRLGMWTWVGIGRDEQWFGVPWANFWAWFLVVWSFSVCIRALRAWQHQSVLRWLYPLAAMCLSLFGLVTASSLFHLLTDVHAEGLASLFVLGASILIILSERPRLRRGLPRDWTAFGVPLVFHLFALLSGLLAGIFLREPVLAVVGVLMLMISLVLHGVSLGARRQSSA